MDVVCGGLSRYMREWEPTWYGAVRYGFGAGPMWVGLTRNVFDGRPIWIGSERYEVGMASRMQSHSPKIYSGSTQVLKWGSAELHQDLWMSQIGSAPNPLLTREGPRRNTSVCTDPSWGEVGPIQVGSDPHLVRGPNSSRIRPAPGSVGSTSDPCLAQSNPGRPQKCVSYMNLNGAGPTKVRSCPYLARSSPSRVHSCFN